MIGAMVAGVLALGGGVAAGCGDKFVLLGRGARVARTRYPSSILIFMNPASRLPAAEKEFRLEATLKAAGHKARVAETEVEVRKELESGKYDLVLGDVADASGLRRDAGAAASKPVVLPLLYKPTPEEISAAEKDASCLARPSKQSRDLLAVVDQTLADRRKGGSAICDRPSSK
ncbi:MAG: hypothetical protein M3R62_00190 [Acidobacteriota bacterium]|nr:hypothetical protein [Acidobacteriota bacterium]